VDSTTERWRHDQAATAIDMVREARDLLSAAADILEALHDDRLAIVREAESLANDAS
jgi:hypothetical protein